MRVVIDTNVVVSAILRDRKPEDVIMFVRRQPEFEWVASAEILAEYTDVIQRKKFNLPHTIIARWTEIFGEVIRVVGVQHYDLPHDQKDARFLACSIAADADFLITGDGDFKDTFRFGRTKVVSVSLFKSMICDAAEESNGT